MGTDAHQLVPFVNYIPWPALVVDAHGAVTAYNDALVESQCVSPSPGENICDVLPHVCDSLAGTPPWIGGQDVEVKHIFGGVSRRDRILTRTLPDGSVILFIVEAGGSREDEHERAQTERLASLGFMAASICHELSNPLSAIRSLVQTLQTDYRQLTKGDIEQNLSLVASNVDRILTISRKLTEFSRVGSAHRGPIRLDDPIESALALTQHQQDATNIEFRHVPDPSVRVRGNGNQLEQVFHNILVNCVQAVKGVGVITVSTTRRDHQYAEVTIADTGPGIAPDQIHRIFEPFYTTKSSTGGTGLGLVISNEIVHEHGGHVRVESTEGSGTSFIVELPLCPRDSESQ